MFGLFKKKESEADFITKADQRMRQSDSLRQMFFIVELLLEAREKEFYAAQVYLIEKYTQWEVDPVMSIQREAALLQLGAKNALEKTSDGAKNSLTTARFRIGNHDLREPDYHQILLWAKALDLDAEEVIRRLEDCSLETWRYQSGERLDVKLTSRIENGSIVALAWDFDLLPLTVFEWMDGLTLSEVGFKGVPPTPPRLSLRLPLLSFLACTDLDLVELDLSNVPGLTVLWCGDNQLTELDLSNVPKLTWLGCDFNKLTRLDLSNIPRLSGLGCCANQLTELDLSNVPGLTWLDCANNQLTELDPSNVSRLTWLGCGLNQLTELDLSNVPELTNLQCRANQLTELDLSNVPGLTTLWCDYNQLTELVLANVLGLTVLWCGDNQLTELNLSNVPELTNLQCRHNQLSELNISPLKDLNDLGCDSFVTITKQPNQKF